MKSKIARQASAATAAFVCGLRDMPPSYPNLTVSL
jgi:hypothetical protein